VKKTSQNNAKSEKEQAKAIEKALRSYGYLFPQSEDEIESLDKIIGCTASPLPDSLKDTSFLFNKKQKKDAKIIPLMASEPEEYYHQAYAARDGQDSLSAETQAKMDHDIKKIKEKKTSQKSNKKK
jgi:hypothetical protein